ncbi:PolC-type DNA polymerase III [Metamycoplasma buccale]|uniref:PolC-type DNA polymerase III n=1 Tax=Metamycoplasma buccale TaxID=55602 RepID=UPI00398E7F9D
MKDSYDQSFLKLCKEIKFNPNDEFLGTTLDKVYLDKDKKSFIFEITLDTHINIETLKKFKQAINNKFANCSIEITIRNILRNKLTLIDYLKYILETKFPKLYLLRAFLNPDNINLTEKEFILTLNNRTTLKDFQNHTSEIKKALELIGFGFYEIKLELIEDKPKEKRSEKIKKITENFDSLKKQSNEVDSIEKTSFGYKRKEHKKIEMSIKNALNSFEEFVTTKGEIFAIDSKKIKGGKTIFTIDISDYDEAISVKYFIDDETKIPKLEKGQTIIVSGKLTNDKYSGSKMIFGNNPNEIIITEDIQVLSKDSEDKKRVELALRTNMSTQDGISTPKEYLKAARKYGHTAIAITDLDDVQNFPDFYNDTKKNKDIKPIYGATLSSITTHNDFFFNFKDFAFANQKYVVFDIETTGLSARFNEIIEFGAAIVENGNIVKRIQFFLKPSRPIPASITKLTKITDDLLADGYSQEEGIKKIYEILNNNISVAHNARFDINVCKENFVKYGLDTSHIYGIDSLAISYFLFPYEKRFKLGHVAKRFNIYYDSEVAHRGDYDAEVLAMVWVNMIEKLKREYNILTSSGLAKQNPKYMLDRKFEYEVRLLAKNQIGLKKLFKLITKSLTSNYSNGPKFLIDKWEKDPDLLLGSGANSSWLWDKVLYGTNENILRAMAPFDYIELPPISTFNYLYNDDWITREQIEFAYKDLISKAKSLGKICVAVSDARYVYDYQKLIHDIYVNAPSLGGGQHWLKRYRKIASPNFKFLNTTDMKKEFIFLNDGNLVNEIVVENTNKIANMISDNIEVIKNKLYVPTFDDSAKKLKEVVYQNAKLRYGENIDKKILDRIDRELKPIIKYGYSVIYWISHKLVKKSNEDGYLVGSRGSVGSSIVANLANITEVNPLEPHYLCNNCKYFEWNLDPNIFSGWDLPNKNCPKCSELMMRDGHNIPFETFLGFEANKVPDIDLNFSGEYQPIIHNYVKELFGENHTFRAGTISTIASKTAYGFCKKYAEEIFKNEEVWSKLYFDFLASKTEGVKRTTGQHPGGIIIIPKEFDVEDFTPINYPANDNSSTWKTTHFDFTTIHDNVLKLDLLGHDDPTVIKMLEDLTNTDAKKIPKMDPEVLKLFSSTASLKIKPEDISGETTGAYGLPEFGTQFVRRMLKTANPQSFNDLILMSGLSHGTDVWSGNAEELIKQGKKLKDCVCCRDDIMRELIEWKIEPLSAFEIMERVRKGKGLTIEQEDLLINNKVPIWYIDSLKKIKYMFPKAHATAYVIMAWRIAWYKLYHPLPFYASFYSNRPDSINIKIMSSGKQVVLSTLNDLKRRVDSKTNPLSTKENDLIPILEITQELYARGYSIKNVSLEKSLAKNWIIDDKNKALIPPFVVVEGLGETVADSIVKAREEHEFLSIEDMSERTKINSKILSELKSLNILDGLDETNQTSLF